jgi:serine/threonine-protein kinase/endoribonuclease IRE1
MATVSGQPVVTSPDHSHASATSPEPDEGSQEKEPEKEKKKRSRGKRGGQKHKKGKRRDMSQSRDDDAAAESVEAAVNNAKKLAEQPALEPDVQTVAQDMQAVTGTILRMGLIEVDTEIQLGTGSNGTIVFAGKFDGREVAVKRMLIQFYDIASQETRLLRETDDHPNGRCSMTAVDYSTNRQQSFDTIHSRSETDSFTLRLNDALRPWPTS